MTPRPQDPELLFAAFQNHCATCESCRELMKPCDFGENLLMAWGDAEAWLAREQECVESCVDDAEAYTNTAVEPYELNRDDHPPFAGDL